MDVTTTRDAGLNAAPDSEQLAFARSQGRVVVTHDAGFVRLHRRGHPHAGIVYSQQGERSIGDTLRGLMLVWERLTPQDMENHVEFL